MDHMTSCHMLSGFREDNTWFQCLTLLHSERPKLHRVLAFLSAKRINLTVTGEAGLFP